MLSLGLVTVELKMGFPALAMVPKSLEYAGSLPLAVGNQSKNLLV